MTAYFIYVYSGKCLNSWKLMGLSLKIFENLGNATYTIISASFSKNLTKTPDFLNTLFLPANTENILRNNEQDNLQLRQKILLSGSVKVGWTFLYNHCLSLLQGQYKFEWITTEDVISINNLCDQIITVYYKNCKVHLSVQEVWLICEATVDFV